MNVLKAVALLTAAGSLAACSDTAAPRLETSDPVFARPSGGGPGSDAVDQPVTITWDDAVNAGTPGIRSDAAGDYTTNVCGVYTSFPLGSNTGQLTADFDYNYDGSCGPRHLVFDFTLDGGAAPAFGSPLISAPKFVVREIDQMAVGESRLQWMGFGIQQENCGRVLFDSRYAGSSDLLITRLADTSTGARQWHVQTQGTETSLCVVAGKGNKFEVKSGPYSMPFAFLITELK